MITIYLCGSTALLKRPGEDSLVCQIISVQINGDNHIKYEVVVWDKMTRTQMWVDGTELCDQYYNNECKKQTIGFHE